MKTSNDPRHLKRQHIVQELFKIEFHPQKIDPRAQEILLSKERLDEIIRNAAPDFPIDKINKVDLAILRLASYELLIEKKEPTNVIIDEAVELAKEFGGDASPSFINGALGKIAHEKLSNN